MNILFASNIEYDCDKYMQLIYNCRYITDIYVANSLQELTDIFDNCHFDLSIVLVKEPSDFGTLAYDQLIENEIDEERIILLVDTDKNFKRTHLVNQVHAATMDQELFNEIISYFNFEDEDE